MSSLTLQFNQFVDFAVNPLHGTVNTVLLHNLLHVIVDQLRLSTNFVEFHGAGSAAIENAIVNSEQYCGLKITEYEVKEEVDDATGISIEKRISIPSETDKSVKVYAITNMEANSKCPAGFPLSPMQVFSVDEFQNLRTSSIHDVIGQALPDDKFFETEQPESSLKAMFDFINLSKRLDALEIGIRQLADIIRKSQCDIDDKSGDIEVIRPELRVLREQIDILEDKIKNQKSLVAQQCKCNEQNFDDIFATLRAKVNQELQDILATADSKLENLPSFHENNLENLHTEMKAFEQKVCDQLESYKNDFVKYMIEVQTIMDASLDKFSVPDPENNLKEKIQSLEEKIENLDFKKALAAGTTKKIFKDLNCVSCGENVIQADARHPTFATLNTADNPSPVAVCIEELQLFKPQTRLCGGKHTVTTPNERIFKSETVKTQCH